MNIQQDEVKTEAVLKHSIKSTCSFLASMMIYVSRIKSALIILMIIAIGSISTLISGFYKQNLSRSLGVSITGYGFPLSWYRESWIVHPIMPIVYSFHWECFALDIAFWSLIVTLLAVIICRIMRIASKMK